MTTEQNDVDVLILGAGAAGLMCAIEAGKRGKRVRLLDHGEHPGEKIRISGGGRCNFTNINAKPTNYVSANPHFATSALKRYTQHDFIKLVEKYSIEYHEKALGQLFCNGSSRQIVDMLLKEGANANARLSTGVETTHVRKTEKGFTIGTSKGDLTTTSLVVATGGLSIPKMGASPFGYEIAKLFDHNIITPRAGLVPLTFQADLLAEMAEISGISVDPVEARAETGPAFREALLFTHRGLSGPVILQISSFWREGQSITINLLPDLDVLAELKKARTAQAKQQLNTILSAWFPKRLADMLANRSGFATMRMADLSDEKLKAVTALLTKWTIKPNGSEGYRTAEVTLGGVDTNALSSKTMESRTVPGLYFVGEVVDVTGYLGGYNFQWAWSSGWVAGQFC